MTRSPLVVAVLLVACGPERLDGGDETADAPAEAFEPLDSAEKRRHCPSDCPPNTSLHDEYATGAIPDFAIYRRACFRSGEEDGFETKAPRVQVTGCDAPIVAPSNTFSSAGTPYATGYGGALYDCGKLRVYARAVAPLKRALADFDAAADALRTHGPDGSLRLVDVDDRRTLCVANTLDAWARADALATLTTTTPEGLRQDEAVRAWYVAGFTSNVLKYPTVLERAEKLGKATTIRAWLARRGQSLIQDLSHVEGDDKRKNIYFWRGYALTAVGFATQNKALVAVGQRVFNLAITQITAGAIAPDDKGFLPMELLRGNKAHHYTLFAAMPLLGMTSLSKASGCSFANTRVAEENLSYLIRKLIEGRLRPAVFEQKTDDVQDMPLGTVERLLSLLGGDAQAARMLASVDSYLAARHLARARTTFGKEDYLGGSVEAFPAPSSRSSAGCP